MNKDYYVACITNDRLNRRFEDFSSEPWYTDFFKAKAEIITLQQRKYDIEVFDAENQEDKASTVWMFWDSAYAYLNNISEQFDKFTRSREILELFLEVSPYFLVGILRLCKIGWFGDVEQMGMKYFSRDNIPLIRLMDFFLEKRAFRHWYEVSFLLERPYTDLWFEITKEEVEEAISDSTSNCELLFLFSGMSHEVFTRFFTKEFVSLFENAPFYAIFKLLKSLEVDEEYLRSESFFSGFKKLKLNEQIRIAELLEDKEYSQGLIDKLHSLFNTSIKLTKVNNNFCTNNFEMSYERCSSILAQIQESSYFKKNNIQNSDLWKIISGQDKTLIDPSRSYFADIMHLYERCRNYATSSIVNALYPLNNLKQKITHISVKNYNILARVRTMWERATLRETFEVRDFCSFSILTQDNMSHYGNHVLYGYYTGVTENMIAHIYPVDSLSKAGARHPSELTDRMNTLLDIDDLNKQAYDAKTYCQLCVKTKCNNGEILWPDCIVCIEEVDERSLSQSNALGFDILVLHKTEKTIECNEDIHGHLK